MTVIASRPYLTAEAQQRYVETFGEDKLSRARWLELGLPGERYFEYRARMQAEAAQGKPDETSVGVLKP